jgi:hypothetical protein
MISVVNLHKVAVRIVRSVYVGRFAQLEKSCWLLAWIHVMHPKVATCGIRKSGMTWYRGPSHKFDRHSEVSRHGVRRLVLGRTLPWFEDMSSRAWQAPFTILGVSVDNDTPLTAARFDRTHRNARPSGGC